MREQKVDMKHIFVASVLMFSLVACQSQKGEDRSTRNGKTKFAPRTSDTLLSPEKVKRARFFDIENVLFSSTKNEKTFSLAENTWEIMRLAETAMILSERDYFKLKEVKTYPKHVRDELGSFGHKVLQSFYSKPVHYSKLSPVKTPFAQVLLAQMETELMEEMGGAMDRAIAYIQKVMSHSGIQKFQTIDEIEEFNPDLYVDEIIQYLERVSHFISEDSSSVKKAPAISPTLVQAIRDTIDDVYIPQVRKLKSDLQALKIKDRSGKEYIAIIRKAFENFEMIRGSEAYSELMALLDRGEASLGKWGWTYGADQKPLIQFANAFNEKLSKVPTITTNKLVNILKLKKQRDNFRKEVHQLAENELRERVYREKEYIPGVARGDVLLQLKGGKPEFKRSMNHWFANLDQRIGIPTGARTLGATIGANFYRLKNIDKYEDVEKISIEYDQIVFGHLNVMLRAAGHYVEDQKSMDSYFRPIDMQRSQGFNVYEYKDQEGVYSIPDQVIVKKDSVDLNLKRTLEVSDFNVSVEGQAELIRGLARALKYFRPDIRNDFDKTMAINVYEKTKILLFPKDKFFDLHIGVLAAPLLNLQRMGTSIFDKKWNIFDIEELNKKDRAVLVALHDIEPEKKNYISTTQGISRMIRAVSEFLNAIQGLMPNHSAAFQENPNTEDNPNYESLKDAENTLKKLNLGLGFLLTSRLQRENGGFIRSVDIKSNETKSSTLYLDDQVSAIRSLLLVHDLWGGELTRFAAIDAYHTMNKELFDEASGFYKRNTKTGGAPGLQLVLETLLMLQEIEPYLPAEDLAQVGFLREAWAERLLAHMRPLSESF